MVIIFKLLKVIKPTFDYKYLTLIYLLLSSSLCYSQTNSDLVEYQPERSDNFLNLDSISVIKGFLLDKSTVLYFVYCNKLYSSGIGLIQFDISNKKVLFQDLNVSSEDFIKPHFFKIDKTGNQILLLCNVGADFSYGIWAYQIVNNKIKNLGVLDISLNADRDNEYDDPIPYTKITTKGKSIFINFTRSVATNWNSDDEKVYQPGKISLIIRNGCIKTIFK
jgi:hypothetical protein